jgi:hypothetical protein
MLGLFLLLLPQAAPPPAIRPTTILAREGKVLITLPTPKDMYWPLGDVPEKALDVRIALEQAARPRLEGHGVALEWLARGPDDFPLLDFVGRVKGPLPPRLRLRYHTKGPILSAPHSVEVLVAGAKVRKGPVASLLRRARLQRLAVDEALSGGWSYFPFARQRLAGDWGVRVAAPLVRKQPAQAALGLYELATGAVSLDEALALGQSRSVDHTLPNRETPLSWVRAIPVPDHPWKLMIRGKPRSEPLAGCVPHDHWYLRVSRLETLAELAETTQAWGGSPLRLAQMNDRDYRLMERYQGQLCLPVKELARAVPAKLVRGIALTGSDLFWAEGTDITVIVDTPDPKKLLKAIDGPLARARKLPGFKRRILAHGGVGIEGFSTPGREVSLYRASVKERVVLSNSRPALERVLDTISDDRKSLSGCLDFQYMRTVFERDDRAEDGFVFLSDDFFRALLSPGTRIKEMRRLSTRAALTAASHAALLHAESRGKWPADAKALRAGPFLPESMERDSEGKYIGWDARRGEAISDTHGTLSRGVPLLEVPIDEVTSQEVTAYVKFRREYSEKWQTFIDPVGIRFHGTPKQMRVEAHMLPLTGNKAYSMLRFITGGAETKADAAKIAPGLVGAFRMHLHSFARADWLALHLDDSPGLPAWAAQHWLRLVYPDRKARVPTIPPVTMVWGGTQGPTLAREIADYQDRQSSSPMYLRDKQTTRKYRKVEITRVPVDADAYREFIKRMDEAAAKNPGVAPLFLIPVLFPRDEPPKAFYTAQIGDGWYTGLSEKALKSRIDTWRKRASEKGDPAAAGLFLSTRRPGMAATLDMLLEMQTRQKAHAANVMWQALYEAGVVTPRMSDAQREQVALRLWGFVPSAPDGSRASWDADTRQVRNLRHGTWRLPASHTRLDTKSPLARFIRRFESLQADLRFREDGIHTVITFGYVK